MSLMYNTAILQRGLASVSLQIALEVYPITNDPVNFATGRTVPCFVTIHKLQEVPPSDTFSPALPPAILCPWQKKKIQLCPLSWITSQMTSVTRQIQGTHSSSWLWLFSAYASSWNRQGYHCRTSQTVKQSWWEKKDRPRTQLGV